MRNSALGDPQRAFLVVEGCEEGYLVCSALAQSGQVTAMQLAACTHKCHSVWRL